MFWCIIKYKDCKIVMRVFLNCTVWHLEWDWFTNFHAQKRQFCDFFITFLELLKNCIGIKMLQVCLIFSLKIEKMTSDERFCVIFYHKTRWFLQFSKLKSHFLDFWKVGLKLFGHCFWNKKNQMYELLSTPYGFITIITSLLQVSR